MWIDKHGDQNGVDEWHAVGLNEGPRDGRWLFVTIVIWQIIGLLGVLSIKFLVEDRPWLLGGALITAGFIFTIAYPPRWLKRLAALRR